MKENTYSKYMYVCIIPSYETSIDHTGSTLYNSVIMTFNLLTSLSVPCTTSPSLVMIAHAVFLFEHRRTQTKSHTELIAEATACIGN